MTIRDPHHPQYLDEADVREELTRVFDVCHGCRRCVDLCTSFPTLFEMIDGHDDRDAGRLTPAQQDRVVDECYQCQRCSLGCPYTPERHELQVDVPRMMVRADAMRRANGLTTMRSRITTEVLGRTDLRGSLATAATSLANRMARSEPGSLRRRIGSRITGVSPVRLLPPYAKERFSTWFRRRPKVTLTKKQGEVTVFPTCLVDYHDTGIGKDLVKVFERNGVECSLTAAGCCGAPWLHAGDVARFIEIAEKNVAVLANEVRDGTEIVVPQPTCGHVLRRDYAEYVGASARADAELVAEHTHDAAEFLIALHRSDEHVLDTEFGGGVHQRITYHTACHLRAQDIGVPGRDLLKLTGARVRLVDRCAGVGATWGFRAENEEIAIPLAERLGEQITAADGEIVAGDCHLANTAIVEQTGTEPSHPLQIIARAYGIPVED